MSQGDTLVLIGPPNSGKTTLFNWITGYNRKTVNYPGSTVELFSGHVQKKQAGFSWCVIDTPGIYSLFSPSHEADLAKKVIKDLKARGTLRALILVIDSTRLPRQLPLAFQLKELGIPFVVALTMCDIQKKEGPLNVKLLSSELGVSVFPVDGLLGGGVLSLLKAVFRLFSSLKLKAEAGFCFPDSLKLQKLQASFLKKSQVLIEKIKPVSSVSKSLIGRKTRFIDSLLLHPVLGFGFLCGILFVFFSALFWLASPFMDQVDALFSLAVEGLVHWGGDGLVVDFLAHGVLTGFGAFFVFVPQVYILFVGIYLLEDSGYLARAATLVDGPFSRIGLSGRSLIPFLSGFACAIPAVLSARQISSKRERAITTFVLPLMTCSARLPVYVLLLSFLFYGSSPWKPGLIMAVLYFLAIVLAVLAAGVLNLFFKADSKSSFLMELPLYRLPVFSQVLVSAWSRSRHFIKKAGPVIFLFTLLMWGATHFPRSEDPYTQVKESYAGRFGQITETCV